MFTGGSVGSISQVVTQAARGHTGRKRISTGGGVGSGSSTSAPAAAAGDARRSSHAAISR